MSICRQKPSANVPTEKKSYSAILSRGNSDLPVPGGSSLVKPWCTTFQKQETAKQKQALPVYIRSFVYYSVQDCPYV